ncbi:MULTISPECIES: cytochrome c family protein [unclassified Roseobacter]|uniref:c-type cytochrome n=1 Tax=unclassified Roseobacter TaxID=196798 RepID=UPI00209BBEAC|nr:MULTISPECIES: c-type cytochrome [unclassified Roseobacter]
MNRTMILAAAASVLMAPTAFAESHEGMAPSGDAAAGEAAFRQCIACHVVANADGEVLAGRNARTGPNLYEISGSTAGTVEGFRYSGSMVEAGEGGLVWDEESFVAYVMDPTGFLRETLDDNGARGSMSFRVRSEEDAANLYAYIASLSTAME